MNFFLFSLFTGRRVSAATYRRGRAYFFHSDISPTHHLSFKGAKCAKFGLNFRQCSPPICPRFEILKSKTNWWAVIMAHVLPKFGTGEPLSPLFLKTGRRKCACYINHQINNSAADIGLVRFCSKLVRSLTMTSDVATGLQGQVVKDQDHSVIQTLSSCDRQIIASLCTVAKSNVRMFIGLHSFVGLYPTACRLT